MKKFFNTDDIAYRLYYWAFYWYFSQNYLVDCSLQRLDADFEVGDYANTAGLTYSLREQKTKNAELLLQQMFEDELDEEDIGPEFDLGEDNLEEIVDRNEVFISRKLTIENIDFVV